MILPDGLYDLLITQKLVARFADEHALRAPLEGDAAEWLADLIGRQLREVLDALPGDGKAKLAAQLALINETLVSLRGRLAESKDRSERDAAERLDPIVPPPQILKAIRADRSFRSAPELGLAVPWLFTAGKDSPALLPEIRKELASAERVDILVSFITVSGVRKLRDVLRQISTVGGDGQPPVTIRVLTTTYIGATEVAALDELARLPGSEVRVSLDGRRTRLHAKAWLFRRRSGFGSAYIGSANLSGAALTGGLEWTVKLTQRSQEALFERAIAHFETLWADSEFESYRPDDPVSRQRLREALSRESGADSLGESGNIAVLFDLSPKAFQREMLNQLAVERRRGRMRNLVVAATGTGKTVLAAFDYRAICIAEGGQPRLLFIAHREEILRQARDTYRAVLRDREFGELLTGQHQPASHDHLFATITSANSRSLIDRFGVDHWHTVVIDECHHLPADGFDRFATSIRPRILLGLTATPERADGQPLAKYFDLREDGSPAVELRLWHALDLQLLSPFEYYACDDPTDFSEVPWDRAGERERIDKLVTGNDARARLVIEEWRRLCADPAKSKALVFCVSVAHAKFMAEWLNRAGLAAECVTGESDPDARRRAPQRLARGDLCALVTVDLYNEGVDLPVVDTLLLLRPTQSPVLFQQQIGRGLRLSPETGKESCLVLDFVGQHRVDFRFDRLLGSLTGLSRAGLVDGIEQGFGFLPPGCHIQLQKQTREQVLRNLREVTQQSWRRLRTELQAFVALKGRRDVRLGEFLREQHLELADIYRDAGAQAPSGWTTLKREAGLLMAEPGPEEAYFSRRLSALLHVDDPLRIAVLTDPLATVGEARESREGVLVQMLAYQIDSQHAQVGSGDQFVERLTRHPSVLEDLRELAPLLAAHTPFDQHRPVPGLEDTPLCLHATYGIRELLSAVGWLTSEKRIPFQAGVLALEGRKTELLFVTLDKRKGYHERIAYRDYAISPDRFHWQTQNAAGPATMAGRRYLESSTNGWTFQLFVRPEAGDPYRACGPVVLEQAVGEKPMSITWQLAVPLPERAFREYSVLRGA